MIKLDMIQIVEFFLTSEVLIYDNLIEETIIVFRNKKPLKT